jgi:hypothetical protein
METRRFGLGMANNKKIKKHALPYEQAQHAFLSLTADTYSKISNDFVRFLWMMATAASTRLSTYATLYFHVSGYRLLLPSPRPLLRAPCSIARMMASPGPTFVVLDRVTVTVTVTGYLF